LYYALAVWLINEERVLLQVRKSFQNRQEVIIHEPIKTGAPEEFVEPVAWRAAKITLREAFGKGFSISRPVKINERPFKFKRGKREVQAVREHFAVFFQLQESNQAVNHPYALLEKKDLSRISTEKKSLRNETILMFREDLEILRNEIWCFQTVLV